MAEGDWGEIIGQMVSSGIGAYTSGKAADAAAEGIKNAQGISAEAAAQARRDILETYAPSLAMFYDTVQGSIDTIMTGRDSTADILSRSSNAGAQIMQQTSQDTQRAILGLPNPPQSFQREFQQMPPEQQQAIKPGFAAGAISTGTAVRPGQTMQPGGGGINYNAPRGPGQTLPATQPQQQQQQPGYGLSQARQDIQQGTGTARQDLAGFTGRGLAEAAGGYQAAGQELTAGSQLAGQQLQDYTGQALGQLTPQEVDMSNVDPYLQQYSDIGGQAAQQEGALSGALGPEAQQQAINNYMESPGQQYLREQQERSLLRNQAAIGGLGGGNVRQELQRQAMGNASTQQQQYLENLRSISGRGLQAGSQQAGIAGGLTGQQMQNQQQSNMAGAGMLSGLGGQLAGLSTGTAQGRANLAQQAGLTQYGGLSGLGGQLAGMSQQAGQGLSGLSTQAGQQMAQIIANSGGNQAQNVMGLGSQLGQLEQQSASNVANLMSQGGQGMAGSLSNLGTNLANINLGQGVSQSNLAQSLGETRAAGILGQGGNFQTGLAGYYS